MVFDDIGSGSNALELFWLNGIEEFPLSIKYVKNILEAPKLLLR